jgi:hypothetical protein
MKWATALSPATRAPSPKRFGYLGLAPQALCYHLLRRFRAKYPLPTSQVQAKYPLLRRLFQRHVPGLEPELQYD